MAKVLRLENVSKRYGEQTAVDSMSFHIDQGEIVGLVGPNGAGKTTLMRIITGLIRNYEGCVLVNDTDIRGLSRNSKKQVGCVIESPGFYPFMSGYQNLQYISKVLGHPGQKEVTAILDLLGLTDAIHKKVKQYSMGMKQRLGIAQALLGKPSLLVLDEPTNGLDPSGIHEMRKYLRETALTQQMSMLVSSHDLAEIERICDRVVIVQNGKMLRTVNLKESVESESLVLFVIETTEPKKATAIVRNLNLNIVSTSDRAIKIRIAKNQVREMIGTLFQTDIDVYGVYEERESLEAQFLGLMGENRIE